MTSQTHPQAPHSAEQEYGADNQPASLEAADEAGFEFELGEYHAAFLGVIDLGRHGDGYAFETNDEEGDATRRFFVYKSGSQGSYRVSQGIEQSSDGENSSIRFMKGSEGAGYQHTQDTQLAPELEIVLAHILSQDTSTMQRIDAQDFMIGEDEVDDLIDDFDEVCESKPLGGGELTNILTALRTNDLTIEALGARLDLPEDVSDFEVQQLLLEAVDQANALLREQALIPDFQNPSNTSEAEHPVLGHFTRESFAHQTADGVSAEWVMAHDDGGRVWIERIRNMKSAVSPYGTDAEMVDSGFLTSKPLEYERNATAIAEGLKEPVEGSRYLDISSFIDRFEPVIAYRNARNIVRQTPEVSRS